jgi:large subunit ribosomal protein L4
LSLKVQEGSFKVVDRLDIPDPKTKHIVTVLKDLGAGRRTLILLSEKDRNIHLASRNLVDVQVLPVVGLNVYDLLHHDHIICTKDALTKLQERLG